MTSAVGRSGALTFHGQFLHGPALTAGAVRGQRVALDAAACADAAAEHVVGVQVVSTLEGGCVSRQVPSGSLLLPLAPPSPPSLPPSLPPFSLPSHLAQFSPPYLLPQCVPPSVSLHLCLSLTLLISLCLHLHLSLSLSLLPSLTPSSLSVSVSPFLHVYSVPVFPSLSLLLPFSSP